MLERHDQSIPFPGIDVVRNRIKGFAQKKVTLPPGRQKLVILDEADRSVPPAPKPLPLHSPVPNSPPPDQVPPTLPTNPPFPHPA